MGADEEGAQRSVVGSRAARTARRSAWAATDVFSDDDDEAADGDARTGGLRAGRTTTAAPSQRGTGRDGRGGKRGTASSAARLPGGRGGNDPVDLLDAGTSACCAADPLTYFHACECQRSTVHNALPETKALHDPAYPVGQLPALLTTVSLDAVCTHGCWSRAGTSRQLARSAAGVGNDVAMTDDFGRDDEGKMIIKVPDVLYES